MSRCTYIGGPMTGIPEFNFPAFARMEWILREVWGGKIVNPAGHFWGITWLPWHIYMAWDLFVIWWHCTDLVLLAGWQNSRGARLEYRWARWLGLRIWTHYLRRIA